MKNQLIYFVFFIVFPSVSASSQTHYRFSKTTAVGGTLLGMHSGGITFGSNPIFLVPIDTLGNVSFTGIINNVRVIGKFAPYSYRIDTTMVQDPFDGEFIMSFENVSETRKDGEWSYYCDNGPSYHEYYKNGIIIQRDTLEYVLTTGKKEIQLVDSMARIRSIIDLYIKKR